MEKNEMIEKMVTILADEFEVETSEITADAPIKETLHLDSLSLVDAAFECVLGYCLYIFGDDE